MDLGLTSKVALVTASSGGMGRNIARTLASEGAHIVLFARSGDKLEAVANEIREQYSVRVLPVVGDMCNEKDTQRLAAEIKSYFGGLDILILNTGRAPAPLRATRDEIESERWHAAYKTQLWSVIQVCNSLLPIMTERECGRIVAITSASVKSPMPHHSLSTVFRSGVTAYMRHLANEVGCLGITVNCVAPALIETPHRSGSSAYTPEQAEARKKMSPIGRMGLQEEVCSVVAFLTSRQAGFVTGSTVAVEGGMVGNLF